MHAALGPLIQAARQGKYLVSLDFSLAFDHCCPATTVWLFQRLGLPVGIGQMLLGAWMNQCRYIEYDGCILQTPEKVVHSLPQGDAWSLYGLIALLMPPTTNVQNLYPNTIHKTYVDDRSWASNSCAEALAVERTWQHWTNLLGLRENTLKSQYFHQSAKGRRRFIENGVSPEKVSDSPCLLGSRLQGLVRRKLCDKECDRLHTAKKRTLKIARACSQRQKAAPGGVRRHQLGGAWMGAEATCTGRFSNC